MNKFYTIELLRFFTSMSVLFYHFRHFFYPFNILNNKVVYSDINIELPFYSFLNPFYEYGFFGVQVFYTISGFVFAHIYLSTNTIEQNFKAKAFFVNRFARLYPLHFLTLFLVLFLQIGNLIFINKIQFGYLIDLYHFVLQLFFISAWGFENGHSFNAPIWSISVEILIYILFFSLITLLRKYRFIISTSIVLILTLIDKIGLLQSKILFIDCGRLFFSGTIIYFLSLKENYNIFFKVISLLTIIFSFVGNFKIFLFCPALVLFFITFEKKIYSNNLRNFFNNCGNLTYSLYLLHIPLQLFICLLFWYFDLSNFYSTHYFLIIYFFILIFMSRICYLYFEHPLNTYIRKKIK